MDLTAPKIAEVEILEAPDVVERKAQTLANHIKKSKHFIAFTGAGISTSAGIPDFRGPDGNWTLRAQGKQRTEKVNTLTAIPTPTHMALVELQNRGILKYLISQNCDGLHRRSGILPDRISELHGNSNRESCKDCGKEYIRDFRAVATYEKSDVDHRTGRKCTRCEGALHDSIVNFGEPLPPEALERAFGNAKQADLCLVLGSSLMVSPANEIPEIPGRRKGAKLAICNLQNTPLDDLSDLRIHSKTDDLMIRVMQKLDIPIPSFVLHRRVVVEINTTNSRQILKVYGVETDGTPVSFLQSVRPDYNRRQVRSEPFDFPIRGSLEVGTELKFDLEFMGHYGEPNLEIVHGFYGDGDFKKVYLYDYDPSTRLWTRTWSHESRDGSNVGYATDALSELALSATDTS